MLCVIVITPFHICMSMSRLCSAFRLISVLLEFNACRQGSPLSREVMQKFSR